MRYGGGEISGQNVISGHSNRKTDLQGRSSTFDRFRLDDRF